jgi:hypothetical protein
VLTNPFYNAPSYHSHISFSKRGRKCTQITMIIAQVAKIATGVLAFCSVRNVVETVSLVNTVTKEGDSIANTRLPDNSGGILQQYINPTTSEIQIAKSKSTNDIVNDLSKMKRKELLTLFLLCEAPKQRADLEGSWEGILLDNNYVLVSVALVCLFYIDAALLIFFSQQLHVIL